MFVAALALLFAQTQPIKIGSVDLFGHTGLDERKLRQAITVKEGQELQPDKWVMMDFANAIHNATGAKVTDVALVGFDEQGRYMVYIGVAGPNIKTRRLRKAGRSMVTLPGEGLQIYKDFQARLMPALQAGGGTEDYSQGFSLMSDPQLRAIQLKMRDYALVNELAICTVVKEAADTEQRRAASQLLGYVRSSKEQIRLLMVLTSDADETVRNNAVRALGVLIKSDKWPLELIAGGPFVDMVRSGTWTDRNKGAMVLEELTAGRNPKLLARLRDEAVPSLLEMARWRSKGHRDPARRILGRVAGLSEERIKQLLDSGDLTAIERALPPKTP